MFYAKNECEVQYKHKLSMLAWLLHCITATHGGVLIGNAASAVWRASGQVRQSEFQ